jgi:hypothetical protein
VQGRQREKVYRKLLRGEKSELPQQLDIIHGARLNEIRQKNGRNKQRENDYIRLNQTENYEKEERVIHKEYPWGKSWINFSIAAILTSPKSSGDFIFVQI